MAKLTKKQKEAHAKIDRNKMYSLDEASSLVKEITNAKFDASVDLAVRLGVDPRKANQMVRGVVTLPHGTGKDVKVLALVTPDKEAEAKEAGADFIGLDEYLDKIKGGWTDVDVNRYHAKRNGKIRSFRSNPWTERSYAQSQNRNRHDGYWQGRIRCERW